MRVAVGRGVEVVRGVDVVMEVAGADVDAFEDEKEEWTSESLWAVAATTPGHEVPYGTAEPYAGHVHVPTSLDPAPASPQIVR